MAPGTVPDLSAAQQALAALATKDALQHLQAALQSLQGLSESLRRGEPLAMEEKRQLERSLLRLRSEIRDAGVLAARGLAYCEDWAHQLEPPPVYQANGEVRQANQERHEVSFEA